jgi:GNAT superfamily N-acetyltransferase
MKEELIIEPINPQNFDDFLLLIDKLAAYEALTPPDKDAKRRLRADGLSKKPKYEAYVGKINGKSIGYIIFYMTYSSVLAKPTLYLEDIFVVSEHRRTGVGQQFLQFLATTAKQRDCGRIEWHVLNWNKPSIQFYEKYHAHNLSTWVLYRLTSDQFDDLLLK